MRNGNPRAGRYGLCLAILFLLFAAGCAPVRMVIAHDPRACVDANQAPPAQSGYESSWAAQRWFPGTAGYDIMLHFSPQNVVAGNHIVNRVDFALKWLDWNPSTNTCDVPGSESTTVEEILRPEGNDVQRHFFPSQSIVEMQVTGMAGYAAAPAGKPFPAIPADQNASFLNLENAPGAPLYIDGLTPAEQAALLKQIEAGTFAQYQYRYQFDGCRTPPRTSCGSRHCLDIEWFDVKNGAQDGQAASAKFKSAGAPVCPVMQR